MAIRTVGVSISLRKTQVDRLKRLQARLGECRSEVVQRAIEALLAKFDVVDTTASGSFRRALVKALEAETARTKRPQLAEG